MFYSTQKNPLISIIIPTYNRGYIIRNVIESVLAQTYPHWELIILDDGSTDETKEIVKSYNNVKIRYFYQTQQGPSSARNKAFTIARGEWVVYIDSDNELLPNYLEVMLTQITSKKNILYAFPKAKKTQELYEDNKIQKIIDVSDNYKEKIKVKDIFMREFIFDINGFMHSREFIDEGFIFDEKLALMEDWDFIMQIATKYPKNFLYVPKILFNYHQRFGTDGLVSKATYPLLEKTYTYIYEKHKESPLMKGQNWHPAKVKKYQKLQKDFLEGKAPPSYLRYFANFIKSENKN